MDHHQYLLVAFATHGFVGYALVRGLTEYAPFPGLVGAMVPDVDLYVGPVLGVPLVHRGALHTPAALAVLVGVALLVGAPRRAAAAFGIGFLSHLVLDSFTPSGVMWLYPASAVRASASLPVHGIRGTAVLWLASLSVLLLGQRIRRRARAEA